MNEAKLHKLRKRMKYAEKHNVCIVTAAQTATDAQSIHNYARNRECNRLKRDIKRWTTRFWLMTALCGILAVCVIIGAIQIHHLSELLLSL